MRTEAAKTEARAFDRELLTPKAAAKLFGKSPEAVRKATRLGRVEVVFDLSFSDKRVGLSRLSSAIKYWGQPDDNLLSEMRQNGHVLSISGLAYNVLSPTPLVTMRDPRGMA